MTNKQGDFIWYELMTSDIDGARAFYGPVAGMDIAEQSDMPGMDYRMIRANGDFVGGVMPVDGDMAAHGIAPMWLGYVAVDDVDAAARTITKEGGHLFVPPRDIPGTGRFAMAADPQGAPFYIMRGFSDETSTVFADGRVGRWGWNELWTPDQKSSLDFFEAVAGWRQEGLMPMGQMGDYLFLFAGESRIGAAGPLGDKSVRAFWRHYFRVTSISASVAAIDAQGGALTQGPHEVPGGDHVIVGKDPQGAPFALVGGA